MLFTKKRNCHKCVAISTELESNDLLFFFFFFFCHYISIVNLSQPTFQRKLTFSINVRKLHY